MSADKPISPDEWKLIKLIFNELIELTEDSYHKRLDELCDNNLHIKPTVVEMVETYFSTENNTITPRESAVSSIYKNTLIETGAKFDKYEIIKPIGSGGMGQVYLAIRNDDVIQKVAIKVLNRHLMEEQSFQRFDVERRILASLEHPNIARLIDAGTFDEQAYYVMEYVEGQEVDEYCDREKLNLKSRLSLFLKICDAVSHAHNNLIVHRDLKPSNILVDKSGEIKLIDFGIAKPLKVIPGTEQIYQTILGSSAMTPQFAAPEQINGDTITVSCDVYVLGLLLYQILSEKPAFDLMGKTWGEIENTINHKMPLLPSVSMKNNKVCSSGVDAVIWSNSLKGDLDAIILHALKKDPKERYLSVQELVDDITRFLQNEPIKIKSNHNLYKFKKFIRKYWIPTAALSAVFVVMTVSLLMIWQQSNTITIERDKAIAEKQVAEEVTGFLVETFKSADPTHSVGTKLSAEDLLEQGRNQIDMNDSDSKFRNRLLITFAEVYMNLSDFGIADSLLNKVSDVKGLGELEYNKYWYIKLNILAEKGETKTALKLIKKIDLKIKPKDKQYFLSMNLKANILRSSDQFQLATVLSDTLIQQAKQEYGKNSLQHATQLREYGKIIGNSANIEEEIGLYRDSIAILEGLDTPKSGLELLEVKRLLMTELSQSMKYQEALDLSYELEQKYMEIFESDHLIMAKLYNSRGRIYSNMNKASKSLMNYEKSRVIHIKASGENSNNVAFVELNIAIANVYRLSNFELGRNYFEKGLMKLEKNSGKTNNYYYMNLPYATCLIKLNLYDEAKIRIAESLTYYKGRKQKGDRNINLAKSLMAQVLLYEGDYQGSNQLLQESMDSVLKHYGDTIHRKMVEKNLQEIKLKEIYYE